MTLDEVICYSKQKESPPVTVIEITNDKMEYVKTVVERLRLDMLEIADTKMVAIINNTEVATKIAKDIHTRCQVMYYDLLKRPSVDFTSFLLTGITPSWITIRDNGYIVKSYNTDGEEIEQWLNTDIENTKVPTLDEIKKYIVTLRIRGRERNNYNNAILELSRHHFINNGVFYDKRQCYYPNSNNTNKEIEDFNRLEKLFKRWGFKSL